MIFVSCLDQMIITPTEPILKMAMVGSPMCVWFMIFQPICQSILFIACLYIISKPWNLRWPELPESADYWIVILNLALL